MIKVFYHFRTYHAKCRYSKTRSFERIAIMNSRISLEQYRDEGLDDAITSLDAYYEVVKRDDCVEFEA